MKNIKLAFRSLSNKKGDSFIKIFSLAIGFAVALVLFAKVNFDYSYDTFYPDSDDLYYIATNADMGGNEDEEETLETYPQVSGGVAIGMKTEVPEVEMATRFTYFAGNALFRDDAKSEYRGSFILADTCLFDLIPRPMVVGNAKEVLAKPMHALVSKSIADKMGGNVIGKEIELDIHPNKKITIGGVFEDIPENASHKFDVITSMSSIAQFMGDGSMGWIGNDRYLGFVKLRKGTNPESLKEAFHQMQVKYQDIENVQKQYGVTLFYTLKKVAGAYSENPEVKRSILLLNILAVAVLLATVLNYILFIISSLVDKSRAVAVHKSYGASRKDISGMMMTEVLLHFLIAIVLAAIFIFSGKSIVENIFGVTITALFSLKSLLILGFILLVIFAFASIVPSYMLSSISVMTALKNHTQGRRGWKLSLLFVQFVASMFLLTLLTIVALQYDKLVDGDHGIEYENLIYTSISDSRRDTALDKIRSFPFVQSIAKGSDLPAVGGGASGNNVSIPGDDKQLFNFADLYYIDDKFVSTLGMTIVKGENFSSKSTDREMIVSEQFANQLLLHTGWTDGVVGKVLNVSEHGENLVVKGVYKDVAYSSLSIGDKRASALFYNPNYAASIVIKLDKVDGDNIEQIQKAFDEVMPDRSIVITPYSDSFIKQYDTENKFKTSVMIVGLIALLINIIGLVAYLNNEVIRRSAEIAIRKINGATVSDILNLFVKNILWLLVPAFLIGAFIAYYVGGEWMQAFTVKLFMNPLIFLSCAIALMLVVLGVVVLKCSNVAKKNPVESLKSE